MDTCARASNRDLLMGMNCLLHCSSATPIMRYFPSWAESHTCLCPLTQTQALASSRHLEARDIRWQEIISHADHLPTEWRYKNHAPVLGGAAKLCESILVQEQETCGERGQNK